jgi:hypothetical protein
MPGAPEEVMEHVDEGTMHAWLDGALSPEEGDRIERHIASCTECSALAAEARGLIAASSRILSALDDVPAGVLPSIAESMGELARANRVELVADVGEASAPISSGSAVVHRGKRAWFLRPQFAAAAAIAFVAVGSFVVTRREAPTSVRDFAVPTAEQSPSAAPSVPAQTEPARLEQPAADASANNAPASTPDSQSFRRDATQRTVKSLAPGAAPSVAPSSPLVAADSVASIGAIRARGGSATSRADAIAPLTETAPRAPSPSVAGAPVPPRALADAASRASRNESSAESRESPKRATDTTTRLGGIVPTQLGPDKITGTDAKRVVGEREAQQAASGAAAFKASAGAPVKEDALRRSIAGCYTIEPRSETADAPIVRRAILDTTAAGEWLARPAWRVTVLSPATLRPVDFRWSLGAEGHVLLLERRDGQNFSWVLDIPQAARSATGIPARRDDCPAR